MTTLLALALALAIWLARRGRSLTARRRVVGWIGAAGAIAAAVVIAPAPVVARKLVGFVLMPTTLVWLALVALVVRSWREPRWRWPLLMLLVAFSVAGSPWTAYFLMRGLERPFDDVNPLSSNDHYEAVLVLGGGTSALPHGDVGDSQLASSGDRVRLAAVLYARGRTPLLVSSGTSLDFERDISAETAEIWRQLGIPSNAVLRLTGARNSVEEVTAFQRTAAERGWRRLAIVSSARHLPRVAALCRRHGLDAVLLPADFRAEEPPLDLLMLLPNGEAFDDVEEAVWEYLGIAAVHLVGG